MGRGKMGDEMNLSMLSAVATAVWSVWTWNQQQERERQVERDREAALYVNVLLAVSQELQAKIYRMLEEGELAEYRRTDPGDQDTASPAAVEFFNCLCQFFGWQYCTFRFGPYTNDAGVMRLTRTITHTFETGTYPGDTFRFTLDERYSLCYEGEAPLAELAGAIHGIDGG